MTTKPWDNETCTSHIKRKKQKKKEEEEKGAGRREGEGREERKGGKEGKQKVKYSKLEVLIMLIFILMEPFISF